MATEAGDTAGVPKLFGPEMLPDPYPVYHRLRAAHPVVWVPALEAWVVTSYEAVSSALRDPQLSSARFQRARQRLASRGLDQMLDERTRSMLHLDPPDHTRLRGLVNKAFTPRAVDAVEGRIQRLVDEFPFFLAKPFPSASVLFLLVKRALGDRPEGPGALQEAP